MLGPGAVGSVAIIAMVASSTLVLVAAASIAGTYAEVTNTAAQALAVDRSTAVTTRPPSTSGGAGFVRVGPSLQTTERIASASSSPPAAVIPAPTDGPTPIPTRTPGPTRTPAPSPGRITDRFPELTPCFRESSCYVYVVRTGDYFSSIVHYYRVDYDTVLRMNPGLGNPARIRPGDEIRIPTPRRTLIAPGSRSRHHEASLSRASRPRPARAPKCRDPCTTPELTIQDSRPTWERSS